MLFLCVLLKIFNYFKSSQFFFFKFQSLIFKQLTIIFFTFSEFLFTYNRIRDKIYLTFDKIINNYLSLKITFQYYSFCDLMVNSFYYFNISILLNFFAGKKK